MSRSTLLVQVGMLARRSVVRTFRQPAMIVPALLFPLLLLAINSSGLDPATELPGFPTDSYFQFALAIAFVQGALFSANSAGTNVSADVETGFLNRLSLTPSAGLRCCSASSPASLRSGCFRRSPSSASASCSVRASRPAWRARS